MGTNIYQQHLLILSEDDAYRDLANGFVGHFAIVLNKIQIDQPAGGWSKLLDAFTQNYACDIQKYTHRHVLMLLDLDGSSNRYCEDILPKIPANIHNRVFVLSCKDEAENIKRELGQGKWEDMGLKLAESCYDDAYDKLDSPWLLPQLHHNKDELIRLANTVRPFIFNSATARTTP